MASPVIRADGLGKEYTIGLREQADPNFREMLSSALSAPFRRITKRDTATSHEQPFWALKDVTFEVQGGEVIGVIGRNAAGKSTLLKILSRITDPTEGRVTITGRIASLLEVGTGFHPELTGRENIYLNGTLLGMSRREIRASFDEIVEFAEVETFLDTPVKRYSSGMYVRLAFAVAAHLEPEILLVDEVLAVGDMAFQKRCLGKIGDIARQGGRTVLFVSHNMSAINTLCEKTILLDKGRIQSIGEPSVVIPEYLQTSRRQTDSSWNGTFSVNQHVLRAQPSKGMTIHGIKIENKDSPIRPIQTADTVVISFAYHATKRYLSPAFVIRIKDSYGIEVIRLSTMPISGYVLDSLFERGRVELVIERLPIVAGRYYVDIGFTRERIEWLLNLEEVLEFEVAPHDVYKSGFSLDRTRGIVTVQHNWSHLQANE